jgi:hypothetical protein
MPRSNAPGSAQQRNTQVVPSQSNTPSTAQPQNGHGVRNQVNAPGSTQPQSSPVVHSQVSASGSAQQQTITVVVRSQVSTSGSAQPQSSTVVHSQVSTSGSAQQQTITVVVQSQVSAPGSTQQQTSAVVVPSQSNAPGTTQAQNSSNPSSAAVRAKAKSREFLLSAFSDVSKELPVARGILENVRKAMEFVKYDPQNFPSDIKDNVVHSLDCVLVWRELLQKLLSACCQNSDIVRANFKKVLDFLREFEESVNKFATLANLENLQFAEKAFEAVIDGITEIQDTLNTSISENYSPQLGPTSVQPVVVPQIDPESCVNPVVSILNGLDYVSKLEEINLEELSNSNFGILVESLSVALGVCRNTYAMLANAMPMLANVVELSKYYGLLYMFQLVEDFIDELDILIVQLDNKSVAPQNVLASLHNVFGYFLKLYNKMKRYVVGNGFKIRPGFVEARFSMRQELQKVLNSQHAPQNLSTPKDALEFVFFLCDGARAALAEIKTEFALLSDSKLIETLLLVVRAASGTLKHIELANTLWGFGDPHDELQRVWNLLHGFEWHSVLLRCDRNLLQAILIQMELIVRDIESLCLGLVPTGDPISGVRHENLTPTIPHTPSNSVIPANSVSQAIPDPFAGGKKLVEDTMCLLSNCPGNFNAIAQNLNAFVTFVGGVLNAFTEIARDSGNADILGSELSLLVKAQVRDLRTNIRELSHDPMGARRVLIELIVNLSALVNTLRDIIPRSEPHSS